MFQRLMELVLKELPWYVCHFDSQPVIRGAPLCFGGGLLLDWRFVRDFVQQAAPLSYLTGKDVPFQWTVDCQQVFEFLQDALCAETVMSHPDFTWRFILYTKFCMPNSGGLPMTGSCGQ